jgi:hypothetical protein
MSQDEREAVIPYAGPTTPRRKYPLLKTSLLVTGTITATVGAALVMVGSTTTRCRGSTRSAKLMWENRQQQMEREIAEELAEQDAPAAADAPAGDADHG